MVHQPVGQWVYVPLGNGVEQQQLQYLVVGQAAEPALQKLRLGPLAVAGVDAGLSLSSHNLAPFLCLRKV